jgi:hypothetical protein
MTERRTADGWGKRHGIRWRQEDIDKLLRLRDIEQMRWDAIGRAFPERNVFQLQSKYHYLKNGSRRTRNRNLDTTCYHFDRVSHSPELRAAVDTARRLRLSAPRPASLTALICGDPPPGRSALDRREAAKKIISLAAVRLGVASPDRTNDGPAPTAM